jgi:hypothetical protein
LERVAMIFEIMVALSAVVLLTKIAFAEERSPVLWGGISLLAVLGSYVIPMMFLRIGVAVIFVFILMIVTKVAMRGRE